MIKKISYSYVTKKIYNLFDYKLKFNFWCILILNIISFFIEGLQLILIISILNIILDPNYIINSKILFFLNHIIQVDQWSLFSIKILILSLFIAFVFINICIRLYLLNLTLLFSRRINYKVSVLLFDYYSNLNFENLKNINFSKIIDTMTNKTIKFSSAIFYFSLLITNIFLIIVIVIILLTKISFVFFLCVSLFLFIYFLVIKYSRKKINDFSLILTNNGFLRNNTLKETFNYYHEIKQDESLSYFRSKYLRFEHDILKINHHYSIINNFPKSVIELIIFILAIFAALIESKNNYGNFNASINNLGFLFYGLFRILPLIQTIYSSYNECKLTKFSFLDVFKILEQKLLKYKKLNYSFVNDRTIKFSNVTFYFDSNPKKIILNNINLDLKLGEIYYLEGRSGSGKSTFLNLLINSYHPKKGKISYNKSCENNFSYIAQDIYILNDNIKRNISMFDNYYGNKLSKRIIAAAKAACIHDYIQKLKKKYQTILNENGKNLSGGQKQRIGIARALYRNKNILILDESTSSVDKINEKKIIENIIKKKKKHQTIFICSHNKQLSYFCTKKLYFKNKKIFLN